MAIQTRIQPRQTIQNVAYAVICLGLGLYGWYDYSIAYPAQDAIAAQKDEYKATYDELLKVPAEARTPEQQARLKEADAFLIEHKEAPAKREAFDYQIQLWLFIVGCGVLGTPWFVWAQWQLSRRRFRLDDDGSFHAAEGSFNAAQITGIDMNRWMSKSIAYVEIEGGRRIAIDDFKYKGVEDIVAQLAARFHPGQWTSDARPIGDPKSRDTKRQLEQQAAEAAASAQATEAGDPDSTKSAS
ncbi:MAG: hypothetical protein RLZZ238_1756 [Planctomycetota bacterium]